MIGMKCCLTTFSSDGKFGRTFKDSSANRRTLSVRLSSWRVSKPAATCVLRCVRNCLGGCGLPPRSNSRKCCCEFCYKQDKISTDEDSNDTPLGAADGRRGTKIPEEMNFNVNETYLWGDSSTVLRYLVTRREDSAFSFHTEWLKSLPRQM